MTPIDSPDLSIGELADRTGVAVSALRFYESKGLVAPMRSRGGQRRFARHDIRRVSFIRITQRLGFTLAEIRERLDALPDGRAPTKRDWERMAREFRSELDARIRGLVALRDELTGCIQCGCLSLRSCTLGNPGDRAADEGSGPRVLIDSIELPPRTT